MRFATVLFLYASMSISVAVAHASNVSAVDSKNTPTSVTVLFSKPVMEIKSGQSDQAVFDCQDAQWLSLSGEPQIPWEVMTVLLPPDADMSSLSCSTKKVKYKSVKGKWQVFPKPPMSTLKNDKPKKVWPKNKTIVNGKDIDIYSQNDYWPKQQPKILHTGKLGEYKLAQIAVPLVRYHPKNNTLKKLVRMEVILSFDNAINARSKPNSKTLSLFKERTHKLADNSYTSIVSYDEPTEEGTPLMSVQSVPDPNTGYAIITTTQIQSSSTKLTDFVTHKESLGFDVQVITELDFGGGTGDAAAENIRTWLQNNYIDDSIEYVLLIGDPNTTDGDVPMKMLWPRYDETEDREAPSDLYYADLTGNWDLDGDGYYGEWDGDFGTGGVDRFYELIVGRIPSYGVITNLDSILQKIIDYESATPEQEQWRKNVLLPMNQLSASEWGYRPGEQIKDSILEPLNWSYHRIYDGEYGVTPPPETIPNSIENTVNVWTNDQFGMAVYMTHGVANFAAEIIDTANAVNLNDNYPSFVFQMACQNAWPGRSDNLSYALLKNGAICSVGATRDSFYLILGTGEYNVQEVDNIAYEYAYGLITDRVNCGESLNNLREIYSPVHSTDWMNFLVHNIYGDPSVYIMRSEDPTHIPITYYVDSANQSVDPNGFDWDHSFSDLQDALALAENDDQILVAEGVYTPDDPDGSRYASFRIHKGISIYGGFPASGGNWQERDPNMYETVLSGDLNNNDLPDFVNYDENSYHVLMGFTDFTLDGFTIRSGNADGQVEQLSGGGMFLSHNNVSIDNCLFTVNRSYGGAIYVTNYCNLVVSNSTFISNKSEDRGGAIKVIDAKATIDNCGFISNSAGLTQDGGAIMLGYGHLTLNNCDFSFNTAEHGGAIHDYEGVVVIDNCFFTSNSAIYGGAYSSTDGNLMTISNSKFYANWTYLGTGYFDGEGGAFYCESPDVFTMTNCVFKNNQSASRGGALYLSNCKDIAIDNCIMDGNYAAEQGGALYMGNCVGNIENCTIVNNTADVSNSGYGGGLYAYAAATMLTVNNTILWNNLGDQIGKRNVLYPLIVNYSCVQGGYSGTDTISSDPLFADEANGDYHLKSQAGRWEPLDYAALDSSSDGFINFADFGVFSKYWLQSGQNLPADINNSGAVDMTDLQLLADKFLLEYADGQWVADGVTSPCIDTGDAASDWMGELWPHGKRINMGVYGGTAEASMSLDASGNPADFDKDDDVDLTDFSSLAGSWLSNESLLAEDISRDSVVDIQDLLVFAENWLWP